ncbi:hypothetical protein RF679_16295 [Undibacterium cyanobacteriorum]|uniref:Phosphodiester glycosidase domain-containing protein n=1 Tax=Undibacterium cyanobacteriorum TaxID=3073561 RepID=A0ABY9RH58_9BURK|nr:hypothetical protein [Undibacterium sp. 20NA77.5]WMW80194.1 hypothetical protein RF679_16295 [Undibacterium sp. 20NA77.5]
MKKRGFVEKPVPTSSDELNRMNRDRKTTFLSLSPDLAIEQINYHRPKENLVFDTGTVKYIGVNQGEFGGGLYLNEVKADGAPFFRGNIQALIPIDDDLYILSGLSHMMSSHGAIHVIRNFKTPSQPILLTLLPDAPAAALVRVGSGGQKSIVFVGSSSLMEFTPDNRIEIIAFNAFWKLLYPTTVVMQDGAYYIGMRSGIAVVDAGVYTGMRSGIAVVNTDGRPALIRYFVPE